MKNYGTKTKQYGSPAKKYGGKASKKQQGALPMGRSTSRDVPPAKPIKEYNYAEKQSAIREKANEIMKTLQSRANKISEPSFADRPTPLPRKKNKIRL